MKNLALNKIALLSDPRFKLIFMLGLFVALVLMSNYVLAADLLVNWRAKMTP